MKVKRKFHSTSSLVAYFIGTFAFALRLGKPQDFLEQNLAKADTLSKYIWLHVCLILIPINNDAPDFAYRLNQLQSENTLSLANILII